MTQTSRIDTEDAHSRSDWQEIFQAGVRRASHDVKDALNGVSVNLEVIRSRSRRPDAPASAVTQFSDAAAGQLDRLTSLIDAILTLSRPEREPMDLQNMVKRLAILFSTSSMASDRKLVVDTSHLAGPATTRVAPTIARLLVARVFSSIVTQGGGAGESIPCILASTDDVITLTVAQAIATDDLRELAEQYGITLANTTDGLILQFPRA